MSAPGDADRQVVLSFSPALYRGVTAAASLLVPLWLAARVRSGNEDAGRLDERYGRTGLSRPSGLLVWAHAASVGESLTLLPLIAAIGARGWRAVVTTGTVTSAALMAERLPANALHQYVPLDHLPWVRRFLGHWRPDLALWTESELWPNMLGELSRQGIPTVLVNGRLSEKAAAGWRRWPRLAAHTLGAFTLTIAQSRGDEARLKALGARRIRTAGNLKFTTTSLPYDAAVLGALQAEFGRRPRWLAASIHPGEDAIVAEVHQRLKQRWTDLLTVVVPRHPGRAAAMAEVMGGRGLQVARRSQRAPIEPSTDIYIADTMGELGLFYRLCEIVFVGKSLAVGGGQNPIEPARIGCALILGADMSNFREVAAEFIAAGAAMPVTDAATLREAVAHFLAKPAARAQATSAGTSLAAVHARALDETLLALEPWLRAADFFCGVTL